MWLPGPPDGHQPGETVTAPKRDLSIKRWIPDGAESDLSYSALSRVPQTQAGGQRRRVGHRAAVDPAVEPIGLTDALPAVRRDARGRGGPIRTPDIARSGRGMHPDPAPRRHRPNGCDPDTIVAGQATASPCDNAPGPGRTSVVGCLGLRRRHRVVGPTTTTPPTTTPTPCRECRGRGRDSQDSSDCKYHLPHFD